MSWKRLAVSAAVLFLVVLILPGAIAIWKTTHSILDSTRPISAAEIRMLRVEMTNPFAVPASLEVSDKSEIDRLFVSPLNARSPAGGAGKGLELGYIDVFFARGGRERIWIESWLRIQSTRGGVAKVDLSLLKDEIENSSKKR